MHKRSPARKAQYHTPEHYTQEQLAQFINDDLLRDAASAEEQAIEGPFYPERGITAESLRAYAAECRAKVKGAEVENA